MGQPNDRQVPIQKTVTLTAHSKCRKIGFCKTSSVASNQAKGGLIHVAETQARRDLRARFHRHPEHRQSAPGARGLGRAFGHTVVKVYEDQGISGAKGRDQRPEFDALLTAAIRREFNMIAVWSSDRLGRSIE